MDANGPSPDNPPGTAPPALDDALLLDWALGQLDDPQQRQVEQFLAKSPAARRRVDPVERTLSVLDRLAVDEPPGDLVGRVCQQVAAARGADPQSARRTAARPSVLSLVEIGAVAAALLLLAIVFIPAARRAQWQAQQSACAGNMRHIAAALEQYANLHEDRLPFPNLPAQGNWLQRQSGKQPSGTAPLFMLLKVGIACPTRHGRLIEPVYLVCPAVRDEPFCGDTAGLVDFPDPRNCSYSFQNLFGASDPIVRSRTRAVPVLADRNPLFRSGQFCRDVACARNSYNHGHEGQNVLYTDGQVRWLTNPVLDGDNIWLAGSIDIYVGSETRQGPDDLFFAP